MSDRQHPGGKCDKADCVGQENWLFAGSERAGKRTAAIQSLFANAKLNGIEPSTWLKDTLEKLPVWTMGRIDELRSIKSTAQIDLNI